MQNDDADGAWHDWLQGDDVGSYVDEEWLEGLQRIRLAIKSEGATTVTEYESTGFGGVGANGIVFSARGPEGEKLAIKMSRSDWSFYCYIRELPPSFLFDTSGHAARLQRKLGQLIGDSMLDSLVAAYREIIRQLVLNLSEWPPVDRFEWNTEEGAQVMNFGVRMPGVLATLERYAARRGADPERAGWAKRTLQLLNATSGASDLRPSLLHMNPLYVWGGAVLSGFFSDLSLASRQVGELLSARPAELETFVVQGWALAKLMQVFQIDSGDRFADFWQSACDGLNIGE
ncbi:hypothetical protein PTKU64_80200 [Paraburkholderia terrae]|uniref:Aminoglycoside phosphotransferase domain-containing protein n=1 Tax=Paraburkholderia terrae TaxID=311230 RepID=A0ABN6JVC5_9BURK|nr:hypothetical protein [Paraburkholderia terrae]BCZ84345.1 hypothetical protein PTKU64_80200 [Paraburkholderia terrae]